MRRQPHWQLGRPPDQVPWYQRPGGIVGQSCVVKAKKKESGLLPVTLSISGALRFATTFPKSTTLSVYTAAVTGRARWRTSPAKSKTTFERGERITVHGDLSKVGTSGSA